MKVLFTGATSLAGAEWCRALRATGHDVTTVSRTAASSTYQVDLAVEGAEDRLPDEEFDALIHFASFVPANEQTSTWEECAPTNIDGTIRLLRWADGRVRRIVLASSCAIYGAEKLYTPTDEAHPLQPDTLYAITKYGQEQLVHAFCASRNVPLVIMRLGYVYGPGIPEGRAVARLLRMVEAGQPITLTNPRTAGLHLIHTTDIARIGSHLLLQGSGAYNVVSGRHISLLEYVTAAMDVTGRHGEILERDDPTARLTNWYSTTRLAREGIEPRVTLREGITSLLSQAGNS